MALNAQLMRYRLGEIQTDETARELRDGPIAGPGTGDRHPAGPGWWPGVRRISNETTETSY